MSEKPAEATAPAVAPTPAAKPSWPSSTVQLAHPVTGADGEEISSLTFLEPDVEALERIEELGIQDGDRIKIKHLRGIAAALSRQPDDVIRQVNARDFGNISEALVPFLEFAVGASSLSSRA